jgi:hypothetical protein
MMENRTAFYSRQGGRQATSAGGGGNDGGPADSRARGCGKRGGGNSNSNSKPRGFSMNNGRGAKLNGDSVCYLYNRASAVGMLLHSYSDLPPG